MKSRVAGTLESVRFRRTSLACVVGIVVASAACAPKSITPMPATRQADPAAAIAGPQGPACRSNKDCKEGEECFAPDFEPGPGTNMCGECKDGLCHGGVCVERCTATSCAAGEECDPAGSGECVARRCTRENEMLACPHNYACGPEGACNRKRCARNDECEGACVGGACYPRPGACEPRDYCCPP